MMMMMYACKIAVSDAAMGSFKMLKTEVGEVSDVLVSDIPVSNVSANDVKGKDWQISAIVEFEMWASCDY